MHARTGIRLLAVIWMAATSPMSGQVASRGGLYHESVGEGPAVVVLHGFAARWRPAQWQALLDSLGSTHRIIGVDVRGFGRSARPHDPEDYGEELAHDVVRVLDDAGVQRATVIGYSMGGIIALKAAALHPERIEHVVLIGQGWTPIEDLEAMAASGQAMAATDTTTLPPDQRRGFRENDVEAVAAMVSTYPALAVDSIALRAIPASLTIIIGSEDPRLARATSLVEARPDARLFVLQGRTHGSVIGDPAYASLLRRRLQDNAGGT